MSILWVDIRWISVCDGCGRVIKSMNNDRYATADSTTTHRTACDTDHAPSPLGPRPCLSRVCEWVFLCWLPGGLQYRFTTYHSEVFENNNVTQIIPSSNATSTSALQSASRSPPYHVRRFVIRDTVNRASQKGKRIPPACATVVSVPLRTAAVKIGVVNWVSARGLAHFSRSATAVWNFLKKALSTNTWSKINRSCGVEAAVLACALWQLSIHLLHCTLFLLFCCCCHCCWYWFCYCISLLLLCISVSCARLLPDLRLCIHSGYQVRGPHYNTYNIFVVWKKYPHPLLPCNRIATRLACMKEGRLYPFSNIENCDPRKRTEERSTSDVPLDFVICQ